MKVDENSPDYLNLKLIPAWVIIGSSDDISSHIVGYAESNISAKTHAKGKGWWSDGKVEMAKVYIAEDGGIYDVIPRGRLLDEDKTDGDILNEILSKLSPEEINFLREKFI